MGGFFGVASKKDCVPTLFYGTDYHSHLGTKRGGLTTLSEGNFIRFIHDITNSPFRSKFEDDIARMSGNLGIGIISDYEDQPLIIGSHLGRYSIVTVGVIKNADEIVKKAFKKSVVHFSEMTGSEINPTELVATLIDQEDSFEAGIKNAQEQIEGSCSILLLTKEGIYASRDRLGRTPVIIGKSEDGYAVTMETCALPNLGFNVEKELGPGETVLITAEGIEQKTAPGEKMQMCTTSAFSASARRVAFKRSAAGLPVNLSAVSVGKDRLKLTRSLRSKRPRVWPNTPWANPIGFASGTSVTSPPSRASFSAAVSRGIRRSSATIPGISCEWRAPCM